MKKIKFLTVIGVIFALFAIFCGAYEYYRNAVVFNQTNGRGRFMGKDVFVAHAENDEQLEQLKIKSEKKYLDQFCDILEEAKIGLIKRDEQILGEEYSELKDKVKAMREEIKTYAQKLSENQKLADLKDRLTELKEQLIYAPDDEQKLDVQGKMQEVLSQITKINLDNFSLLSQKKREIDALVSKMKQIIEDNKDRLKSEENAVLDHLKDKIKRLMFAYKEEIGLLNETFGKKEKVEAPDFLKYINLNARLVDFDKQLFLAEYEHRGEGHHHHHDNQPHSCYGQDACDKNCSSCASGKSIKTYVCENDEDVKN